METITCNKKVLRKDDYKCTERGPVLHGEVVTEYGTFIYDYNKYLGRKENT